MAHGRGADGCDWLRNRFDSVGIAHAGRRAAGHGGRLLREPRVSVTNAVEKPTFETDDSARIFRYVERNVAASTDELHDCVYLPASGVDEVAIDLVRDGFLFEFAGALQLVLGAPSGRTRGSDGSVVTVRPGRQENRRRVRSAGGVAGPLASRTAG